MHPFQKNSPLAKYSTFGIGGPARLLTEATTIAQLQELIQYCSTENLPFLVLGKGSNSLFDDRGFDGLVILNKIQFCKFEENQVHVGAGYNFSLLGSQTARKGFGGLEFASGIPGSVGGAIFMNAGAGGSEVCDVIHEVEAIDPIGERIVFRKEELFFSYRHSFFQDHPYWIAAATFQLTPSQEARKTQLRILDRRAKSQPYGEKSCGCVFRNPDGESAGALIEKCGLKGVSQGGAEVSTLHANFIVNKEGATAKEVLELAKHVKECVKEATGITLEMELRTIPYQL